jgi:hypothetical protein
MKFHLARYIKLEVAEDPRFLVAGEARLFR